MSETPHDVEITVTLTMRRVYGDEAVDEETLIDAVAATIGRQNTATNPLRVGIGHDEVTLEDANVYECWLVE